MKLIVAIAIAASCAFSQPFSGPVEGYVFDAPSASIRPILGRPGAAHLGPAQVEGLTFGSIAPGARHGVAIREDRLVMVSGLGRESASAFDLGSVQRRPEAASWSPDGRTAVLYSREEGWLQVLRDLPESPAGGEIVSPGAGGGIRQVVTDGDSLIVLFDGDAGLARLSLDGTPLPAPLVEDVAAIALGSRKNTAYLADRDGTIFFLDWQAQAVDRKFSGAGQPRALHLIDGSHGRQLLAAVHGDHLTFVDTLTWEAKEPIVLDFAPEELQTIRGRSILLQCHRTDGEPIWLATSDGVLFVPAPSLSSASEVRTP